MFIIAQVANDTMGQLIAGLVVLLTLLSAVGTYFATRRELEKAEKRIERLEADLAASIESIRALIDERNRLGEERASKLHARIDPLAETCGEIRGQLAAFNTSFNNFTKMIEGRVCR